MMTEAFYIWRMLCIRFLFYSFSFLIIRFSDFVYFISHSMISVDIILRISHFFGLIIAFPISDFISDLGFSISNFCFLIFFRSQHFGFINSVFINLFPTFQFSFFVIFLNLPCFSFSSISF